MDLYFIIFYLLFDRILDYQNSFSTKNQIELTLKKNWNIISLSFFFRNIFITIYIWMDMEVIRYKYDPTVHCFSMKLP